MSFSQLFTIRFSLFSIKLLLFNNETIWSDTTEFFISLFSSFLKKLIISFEMKKWQICMSTICHVFFCSVLPAVLFSSSGTCGNRPILHSRQIITTFHMKIKITRQILLPIVTKREKMKGKL